MFDTKEMGLLIKEIGTRSKSQDINDLTIKMIFFFFAEMYHQVEQLPEGERVEAVICILEALQDITDSALNQRLLQNNCISIKGKTNA